MVVSVCFVVVVVFSFALEKFLYVKIVKLLKKCHAIEGEPSHVYWNPDKINENTIVSARVSRNTHTQHKSKGFVFSPLKKRKKKCSACIMRIARNRRLWSDSWRKAKVVSEKNLKYLIVLTVKRRKKTTFEHTKNLYR